MQRSTPRPSACACRGSRCASGWPCSSNGSETARHPSFEVADGTVLSAEVTGVGADWVALDGGRTGGLVVPFASIATIGMPHADMLRSARPAAGALRAR